MLYVNKAEYKGDYKIWCEFSTGEKGIVNLEQDLWGPVFEPLRDKENFKKFCVSKEFHTITWYNGADFAPEFLYEHIESKLEGDSIDINFDLQPPP